MSSKYVLMCEKYAGLAWKFQVNPLSCGNPKHYEDYLRLNALSDQIMGRGVTHLFVFEDDETHEERIMGYVTLKAASLIKEFDEYDEGHSALEICELAVDKEYEGNHVGTDLVKLAIIKAFELNEEHIGIEYLTLCADPSAVDFYLKPELGFQKCIDYYDLPREGWNINCTAMFVRLFNG